MVSAPQQWGKAPTFVYCCKVCIPTNNYRYFLSTALPVPVQYPLPEWSLERTPEPTKWRAATATQATVKRNPPIFLSWGYLVLLGKGLVAAVLVALEVSAVFPRQVSPEGGEGEHDGDVAHVAGILGRLALLLLLRLVGLLG